MADTLVIQIDLEKGDINPAFKSIEKKAKKSGKEVGKSFGSTFGDGFKQVLAANLGADAIKSAFRGIVSELGSIVDAGRGLEVIETQFKTILGSTAAAQKQLSDLQQFAAKTPFQLPGLALSTRQLLSFGVASEDVIPTLRQLGDLAAGTGSEISDLAIPFGRLISTQKLTLVELDKFADRGINLYQAFADSTGKSIGEVREAVSKGQIPFAEFEKAIASLTGEGGKFFNSMAAQSRTLSGVISTFGDVIFNVRANLGKLFSPIIIAVIDKVTKSIEGFGKSLNDIKIEDVSKGFIKFNDDIITFVISPLEILGNVFRQSINNSKVFVNAIIAGFGQIALAAAKLLEFLDPDSELALGLKGFGVAAEKAFVKSADVAIDSFKRLTDTPIAENLRVKNEELATALDEMNTMVAEKGEVTKGIINSTLTEPSKEAAESVMGAWNNLSVGFTTTTDVIKQQSQKTAAIIKNSLVKGIAGGIQNVVTSLVNGEDAFKNFSKFILSTIGDLAIQLGTFFIAEGIAVEALNAISGSGAIAAGAALVALGSLIKASTGGGGAATSTAGAGGTTGIGTPVEEVSFGDSGADDEEFKEKTNVQLVVNGDVFNNEETGRTLLDVFNDNFDNTGATFTGARFA